MTLSYSYNINVKYKEENLLYKYIGTGQKDNLQQVKEFLNTFGEHIDLVYIEVF